MLYTPRQKQRGKKIASFIIKIIVAFLAEERKVSEISFFFFVVVPLQYCFVVYFNGTNNKTHQHSLTYNLESYDPGKLA